MSRTRSKTVFEDSDSVSQDESGSGESTMAELLRILKRGFEEIDNHFNRIHNHSDMMNSHSDIMNSYFEELTREAKTSGKRLDVLLHQVQQPRLAAKSDVKRDFKNRARKEDAVADKKFRDISSVDDPMNQTSFGDK